MSYDVCFMVKVEGKDKWVEVGDCDANITWNLRDMIVASTGLEWKNEENNGLCKDVIPAIKKGYDELQMYPDKYEKYEAPNGWGTIGGCIRFFGEILEAWELFLTDHEELADVVAFWIW